MMNCSNCLSEVDKITTHNGAWLCDMCLASAMQADRECERCKRLELLVRSYETLAANQGQLIKDLIKHTRIYSGIALA